MSDQESRELAASDLRQSFIVDAGAGTGKTTVLISRILGAVVTGKSDLEHIVAITFTEKAAGELKVRLRFELEQALYRLHGEEWERVYRALGDIERAQVATIHSFCAALLRERPVEARVEPDFEVLDELGANLLIDRSWQAWLAAEMERGHPLIPLLLRSGITLEQIQGAARFLLDHRDLLESLPSSAHEGVEDFLRLLAERTRRLAELLADCQEPSDRAATQIATLREGPEKIAGLDEEGKRDFLLFNLEIQPSAGNQRSWRRAESLAEAKRIFKELKEEREKVTGAIRHNRAAALIAWLCGFVRHYDEAKRELGSLDFFDLLYRCRELLKTNKWVRGYFQERFDYLLVDEFQDTDPLQTEVLFFLAEKTPRAERWEEVELRPGKLFLVGDPKQSIYRFRRADIEAYHEAKAILARQGAVLDLSLNFRSQPAVVDYVNALFSRLIRPPENGAYQPAYRPIAASRSERGAAVWLLPLPPRLEANPLGARELRTAEARAVAAFLKQIVDEGWSVWDARREEKRRIGYGDVGILFRSKEAIDSYEEEFRDFEIPYRVAGGRRYYSRLEMGALLALLSALDNPKDSVAVTAALRSPFFAVSDEELFIAVQEGHPLDYLALGDDPKGLPKSIREAARALRELHDLRNRTSVSLFLLKIYEATRILALLYLKPQGDQKVANLLKLVELARALEGRGLVTLRSFVQFLKKMEATEAEEGESPLAEESEDAVRIMTIHKAKGLEFPLVILADAAYEGRHRSGRGVVNRAERRLEIRLGDQEKGIATQGFSETIEKERLREEAEDCRLLYVAATRARDYCVIPLIPGNAKKRFLSPFWEGLDLDQEIPWGKELSPFDHSGVVTLFDSRRLDTEKRELRPFRIGVELDKALRTRPPEGEPSLARYRAWEKRGRKMRERGRPVRRLLAASAVAKREEEAAWAYGSGAAFGRYVHDLFRRIDCRDPQGLKEMARALARDQGLDEGDVERGIGLAEWGLNSSVLRRAARSPKIWKELPFVYRHGNDLVEGFIDLVFEEGNKLVVVDFKTDAVEEGRELEERVLSYTPQGLVYALALEKITRKKVKEVVLLFLSAKAERSIPLGKKGLGRAAQLLKEAAAP